MSEGARKASVEVVPLADAHADTLAAFFRAVHWDSDATPDSVRRVRRSTVEDNPFFPGEEAPTILFLVDGRAVGYVASTPILIWSDGRERRAEWVKGLMVLPEYRNGPIGFLLVKELLHQLACPLSLAVTNPTRRLLEAFGLTNVGLLPNYLRLLDPGSVLKKLDPQALGPSLPSWIIRAIQFAQKTGLAALGGACVGGGIGLKVILTSLGTRSLEVSSSDTLPESSQLDRLWEMARRNIAVAPVRDGRYFPWRYGKFQGYRAVMVHEKDELVGIALVRAPRDGGDPRLHGIRVALLAELLFPPERPDVAAAALQGAQGVARALEAEALLSSASHSAVRTALARQGYLPIPGNLRFFFADSGHYGLPRDLANWWLTRGDNNADQLF
jgi:GNAT superfamily N-acetyltransferase